MILNCSYTAFYIEGLGEDYLRAFNGKRYLSIISPIAKQGSQIILFYH